MSAMIKRILVATHGTAGAQEAEEYALQLARLTNAELHGLYVIHKAWGSLVGIEWLHTSHVRMEFFDYAEKELYRMAEAALERFRGRAAAGGLLVATAVKVGDPAEVMAEEARAIGADLIVLGSVSRVRSEEYQARVSLRKLMKASPCSVLQVKAGRGKGGERQETDGSVSMLQNAACQ